jgi:hypothetical protein
MEELKTNEGTPSFNFDLFEKTVGEKKDLLFDVSQYEKKEPIQTTEVSQSVSVSPDSSTNNNTNNGATQNNTNISSPKVGAGAQYLPQEVLQGVNGEIVLTIGDIVLSRIASIGLKFGGYDCDFNDMKLTADEKKQLRPLVDVCLAEWIKKLTPEKAFYMMVAVMYGSKIITVTMFKPTVAQKIEAKKEVKEKGTDGRGRHKKDCTCVKCLEKKGITPKIN